MSAWHVSDRHFLASLKLASVKQLRAMKRVFCSIGGPDWKLVAVKRELARRA